MKSGNKLMIIACIFLVACASPRTRSEIEANQKLARENELRLASLENSINELNSQVSMLNNRVYEVRTKTGQKTSMTVVPIGGGAPQGTAQQAPSVPVGKKVEPAKPAPKPAQTAKAAPKASPKPAATTPTGGPSGRIASQDDLALPPAELPPADLPATAREDSVPVPQGNSNLSDVPPVPLPLTPVPDLSLPPEQPVSTVAPAANKSDSGTSSVTPAPAQKASRSRTPQQGEQAAYNSALNAARSGKTAEGIRLFRDFLQKYPNGPYAANAEYWIGECLYAQGKYPEALSEFQTVNNSFPSHHKNADALLKAGMTLSKMGDKDGAAAKYRTLIATFPNSEAARRAKAMGAK